MLEPREQMDETVEQFGFLRKEHNSREQKLKDDACGAMEELTASSCSHLRYGVSRVYDTQKQIKTQTKILQEQTLHFRLKTDEWVRKYNRLNQSLRELGDIRNWSTAIMNDLRDIKKSLGNIVEKNK